MSKILISILVLLSVSCQSKEPEKTTTSKTAEVKEEVKNQPNQNKVECEYSQNLDNYLDEIISNPKKFVNDRTDDNCVLSLIDALNTRSINGQDERYFKAIGAICNISDGYVSEHLTTIAVKQYYHNLKGILDFVKKDSCFREMVVMGLSMEVSVGGNKEMEKIQAHSKSTELSEENRTEVQNILSEIDPEIFD